MVLSPNVWQFTVSSLADGVYNITATIEDSAGNVGRRPRHSRSRSRRSRSTLPGDTVSPAAGAMAVDLAAQDDSGVRQRLADGADRHRRHPASSNSAPTRQTLTVESDGGRRYARLHARPERRPAASRSRDAADDQLQPRGHVHGEPARRKRHGDDYGTAASDWSAVTVTRRCRVQVGNDAGRSTCPPGRSKRSGSRRCRATTRSTSTSLTRSTACLIVDGGEPTTVNKGNDALNLFDMSAGQEGHLLEHLRRPAAGCGRGRADLQGHGEATRVDYVGIEKQTPE